jgi:hypothetical protein
MTANFYTVLKQAVSDLIEHGFDSTERVADWVRRLKAASRESLMPEHEMEEQLRKAFDGDYERLIGDFGILKYHPEVSRFTVERLKPQLRAEHDRRRIAARNLIKLNRTAMVEKIDQKFSGWASSIPPGGIREPGARKKAKDQIRSPLKSLPFQERRVFIDQSHKFVANLNNIIATDAGAIAAEWHSRFRVPGYQYREDHKDRDGRIYAIRGNWAMDKGLMKVGSAGYLDQITQPSQEVSCRCWVTYVYSPRRLPDEMLTQKGRSELQRVAAAIGG